MDWIRVNKLKLNPVKKAVPLLDRNLTSIKGITPVLTMVAFLLKAQVHNLEALLDPSGVGGGRDCPLTA